MYLHIRQRRIFEKKRHFKKKKLDNKIVICMIAITFNNVSVNENKRKRNVLLGQR